MTAHQQTNTSPFFIGNASSDVSISDGGTITSSAEAQEQLRESVWTPPREPETLSEDSNAAETREALLKPSTDDPDAYDWIDIGKIEGGGVYVGPSPSDFIKSDDLQIAKRGSDGQLLVRHADSETIMEVRNRLGRPYQLSAEQAAGFIAQFSGFDSRGSKRKFAQSDIMNG